MLVDAIREREVAGGEMMQLEIPYDDSRLSAKLHEVGEVFEQRPNGEATHFSAWVPRQYVHLFERYAVRLDEKVG